MKFKKGAVLILVLLVLASISIAASPKNICIDTDANKDNPDTKRGYVQTQDGTFWDECNEENVIEMYCSNGKVDSKEIKCEKGCNRGACSRFGLFKASRLKFPLFSRFETFFELKKTSEKKVSEYEVERLDADNINSALRDIDKRLSIIESNLPEQSIFPIIIEANGKKLKAVSSNDKITLVDASIMLAEAITDARLKEGEMKLSEFYELLSESNLKPVTKRGRALMLIVASY